YAGINICMRQSGTYKGRYKISKKGRPRLRKILGQIILPLVKKDALYGPFYHDKRTTMPGPKAMMVVMRQFLRKLHGWYRSGQDFDAVRFFNAKHEAMPARWFSWWE
ncbi:MAG: transposase, partial [Pirellulaceae bacterium]